MGLDTAITLLEDVFFRTAFNEQTWLMYIIIIVASMVMVTRKWSDWATLALPMCVGWGYFGINIPFLFYAAATLIFVVDALSVEVISGAFTGLKGITGRTTEVFGGRGRLKRRMDKSTMKKDLDKMRYDLLREKKKMSNRDLRFFGKYAVREEAKRRNKMLSAIDDSAMSEAYRRKYYPDLIKKKGRTKYKWEE